MGLIYEYGQLKVCDEFSERGNFDVEDRKTSYFYRFETAFSGLTVKFMEFQKIMVTILRLNNMF